jgi:histidine triad (HIT) family protein
VRGSILSEAEMSKFIAEECIFCRIINGKEDSRKLYENEAVLCIVDVGQVVLDTGEFVLGRCLAIPKRHVNWFYELDDEEGAQLFIAAKIVANKIKKAFNPEFVTVFIRGQRVLHAHIILQPSNEGDPVDRMFRNVRDFFKIAPEATLDEIARKIREVE